MRSDRSILRRPPSNHGRFRLSPIARSASLFAFLRVSPAERVLGSPYTSDRLLKRTLLIWLFLCLTFLVLYIRTTILSCVRGFSGVFRRDRKHELPVEHVGLLSFLIYTWLDGFMWKAFRNRVDVQHIWTCPEVDAAQLNADRYVRKIIIVTWNFRERKFPFWTNFSVF